MYNLKSLSTTLLKCWPFVLGLSTAYLATGILAGATPLPVLTSPRVKIAQPNQNSGQQIAIITENNVLGLDNPAPKPKAGSRPDPESWGVLGIFTGGKHMALIQLPSKTEAVQEGQEVQGWLLEKIEPTHLLFTSGRERVELSIFKTKPKINLVMGQKNKLILDKAEASKVLNNPNMLLQQALFKPHMQDGKVGGFRISNIKSDSLLQRMGLHNNDVLVRINGESIDGPAKMMQVYSGLQSSKAITLNVLREGQVLTLVVEVD
ncbi:MAG: PDZ domain-containing protein [Desulfovibrionaceae bacterium]